MKKILLFAFGLMTLAAQSQVELRMIGETADFNGQTLTYDILLNEVPADDEWAFFSGFKIYAYNTSNEDLQLRVRRVLVDVPSEWRDQICWPPNCFDASGTEFLTPHNLNNPAPIVLANSDQVDLGGFTAGAEIKPQIYPKNAGSSATYKYVVVDINNQTEYAEVTVVFNYVNNLSTPTVVSKTMELSLSPNPASDYATISIDGLSDAKLKIVDVLGNIVYTSDFNNAKKLNLSDFRNGVYFITIQTAGSKTYTKKLVVKH